MRKVLSLALFLVLAFAGSADAQWRKTWDFTKGLSEETQENLKADTENWSITYQEDGTSVKEAKDQKKLSGELKANGKAIEELRGIEFGTAGLSNNNNYIVASTKFRVTRNNMEINLPRLAAGQTVTLRARSANSTATNRGFKVGNDDLEVVSGPEGGLCKGSSVEDPERDADGNYTFVWKVRDDADDSVDVQIKTITGGLDIALIMIDNGDGGEEPVSKIAYLFDSGYEGYSADADLPLSVVNNVVPTRMENIEIVTVDVAGDVSALTQDSLQGFNVIVVSDAVRKDNPFVQNIKNAIAFVPMLNLSPNLYETWGYGKAVPTATGTIDIPESKRGSALFKPFSESTPSYIDENGQLNMFTDGTVLGYETDADSYFAGDDTLATAGGVNAIHIHNANRNAYMMLPYPMTMGMPAENFGDILPNAIVMLNNTKRNVTKAALPQVKPVYHNRYTTVELECATAKSKVYYTTDGTTPTTGSTLYTEPFDIDVEGVAVKAVAIADGYLLSDVADSTIEIHDLVAAPAIELGEESGKTTVTIVPEEEGDSVYYNFTSSTDTLRSSVYSEPIVLTKHATITLWAKAKGDRLQSEVVSQEIRVKDEAVRMDVLAHMDANKTDWNAGSDGKTYYFIDKGGYPFYTDEIIKTDTYKDQNGNDSVVNTYKEANQLSVYDPQNGWEFKTYGQVGLWQGNNVSHNVGDFNGYNPETALDDDDEVTSYHISFSSVDTQNGDGVTDPGSACIQSTVAFQAPFDVVSYISGHNSKVKLYVSADTTDADGWKEVGDLYSGSISGKADNGKDGSSRIWKKTILPYNGTDQVFIKIASGGNAANIFDIFVKYEGELSKAYKDKVAGIENVNTGKEAAGEVVRTMVYSINGTLLDKAAKGINIVREVYANGAVKTKKVIVR